jgi:hypothetical protein
MTVDCQWVEKNLEALFCDRLSEQESRLIRTHMESCASCREEAQALNAIDPLVKSHFRRELNIARQPRVVHRSRVLGLGATAAAVLAAALLLLIRTPQPPLVAPPIAARETGSDVATSTPAPPPVKETQAAEVTRAKPAPDVSPVADQKFTSPALPADAPDFRVTDPAGYTHTLADYRGHLVVIGVWRTGQPESINAIERLYKANAANSKIRFLGVSNEKDARPRNTTFPIVYNQGSKMFGAQPGDFVVLDESGAVQLRGSLVKDYEALRKALQGK